MNAKTPNRSISAELNVTQIWTSGHGTPTAAHGRPACPPTSGSEEPMQREGVKRRGCRFALRHIGQTLHPFGGPFGRGPAKAKFIPSTTEFCEAQNTVIEVVGPLEGKRRTQQHQKHILWIYKNLHPCYLKHLETSCCVISTSHMLMLCHDA